MTRKTWEPHQELLWSPGEASRGGVGGVEKGREEGANTYLGAWELEVRAMILLARNRYVSVM